MLLFFIFGCAEQEKEVEERSNPPVISDVLFPADSVIENDQASISATVSDEDGVAEVAVYYRPIGESYWDSFLLDGEGEQWDGTFEQLREPGVEFYLKAIDSLGLYSLYPEAASAELLSFEVKPLPRTLPFLESFELEEGQFSLRDRDWWNLSDGRSTYKFNLNTSQSHSGSYSVRHPRGAEGIDPIRDWLVSPPLDFAVENGIMVSWWEFGLNVEDMDAHKLWISRGSRVPEDGDFEQVAVLDSPLSGEWGRYRYLDLSRYQGEPLVYLAWSWEGSNADEWFIDDVSVTPLAADFDIELLTQPNPLSPDSPATFTVLLSNENSAAAENVSVSLHFPEGGVVPDEMSEEGLTIDGDERAVVEFTVNFEEGLETNRYLPVEIQVETEDNLWTRQERVLLGYPSRAQLEMIVSEEATTVVATIGVGDPTAPLWSESLFSGALEPGTHSFTKEITDQYQWLPPQPGDERWFIQIDSSTTIEVSRAYISYEQRLEQAETPNMIFGSVPETILLPPPPRYYIESATPTSAAPGDQNIPINLSVFNYASPSQGQVMASVVSNDPAVTVQNGENILVDANIWQNAESHTITGPSISIDSTHVDSQPVHLELLLMDSAETISLPIEIDVPWPRLGIVSVSILDEGDGILEPNETADLEITIANTGALSADGIVTAVLSLEASSTATATIVNNAPNFGFMNAGDFEDEDDFAVTVVSGVAGDSVDFLLEMTDNQRSYVDRFQLVLGEKPWTTVSPFADDGDDSLRTDSPDILRVEQRVINGIVELRVETTTPIDPARAFFEAWGLSSGSDYAYYRWVVQSGVATMQGYISGVGFQPLGSMSAIYEDDYHVILTFDSTDLELSIDSFRFGLAAGWCGPPEYFCDHYPNNWGYPYESFSTGNWFEVSW